MTLHIIQIYISRESEQALLSNQLRHTYNSKITQRKVHLLYATRLPAELPGYTAFIHNYYDILFYCMTSSQLIKKSCSNIYLIPTRLDQHTHTKLTYPLLIFQLKCQTTPKGLTFSLRVTAYIALITFNFHQITIVKKDILLRISFKNTSEPLNKGHFSFTVCLIHDAAYYTDIDIKGL